MKLDVQKARQLLDESRKVAVWGYTRQEDLLAALAAALDDNIGLRSALCDAADALDDASRGAPLVCSRIAGEIARKRI